MTDRTPDTRSLPPALARAEWTNPPSDWWADADGTLHARSAKETDFWRGTHYGFIRDDGHALLTPHAGEFTAALTFSGDYETLYDQAGLMVRAGPEHWVKFGVELTDGVPHLSCVVTHGVSDWSARPMSEAMDRAITIRATRIGDALLMQAQDGNAGWRMERLAPWPVEPAQIDVGLYLCSPQRGGFTARFASFDLGEPTVRELHA
jgi:regulation of enolase protein 1 (concanavalin A-like superfamily)